jgi:hypothetical protein
LQGSTVFTGVIVVSIVFITLMGYTSGGARSAEKRPPILLIVCAAAVGLAAVAAYLLPNQTSELIGYLDRVVAR